MEAFLADDDGDGAARARCLSAASSAVGGDVADKGTLVAAEVVDIVPAIGLEIRYLSGKHFATVPVHPSWSGAQVREALQGIVGHETYVTGLLFNFKALLDTDTVADLGLQNGSEGTVVVGEWHYYLHGAGVKCVDGHYIRQEGRRNGAGCYINAEGIMLFRYRFRSGKHYWYLSDGRLNLDQSKGDYYRVKTEITEPPLDGWTPDRCPAGRSPVPVFVKRRSDSAVSSPTDPAVVAASGDHANHADDAAPPDVAAPPLRAAPGAHNDDIPFPPSSAFEVTAVVGVPVAATATVAAAALPTPVFPAIGTVRHGAPAAAVSAVSVAGMDTE